MRFVITESAKHQIYQIAKYIRKEFGKDMRDEFMQDVRHTYQLIKSCPHIGREEPLLAERPVIYRSYVMNRFDKIIYRIDGDIIYIVAFWDVRQDPTTLANEIK